MGKKLVIAFYAHQEHYPPTLNAIAELSKLFDEVAILYRNNDKPPNWAYPPNVTLHPSGGPDSIRQHEQASSFQKLVYFGKFVRSLARLCRQKKPRVLLLYDPHALSAFSFVRKFIGDRPIVWYHNHDVLEATSSNPLSITAIGKRREPKMFPYIDIFSLPSEERKPYFPMDKLKGTYFFLPNLPSISFYGKAAAKGRRNEPELRIIFQGNLSPGHGIEELVSLLPLELEGRRVKLVMAGWLRGTYKEDLLALIEQRGAQDDVELVGFIPYRDLPKLTASCHVGNAVYASTKEVMNRTVGTASNKIYEYAAVGLPVLYFENPHFKKHLGKYEWAIPTDLSKDSLLESLRKIIREYEDLSGGALRAFREELNYEKHFRQIADFLKERIVD